MFNLEKLEWTLKQNIREGNGEIYVSNDVKELSTVVSAMCVLPGSSIGLHTHPKKENVTEVYQVLFGPAPLINGVRTKVAVCRPGKSHNLINDTTEEIIVLSIKSE